MIAWRLRALEQQMPAAAFPAGSAAPSLVYLLVTMVVAAAAVLGFAVYDQRGVPSAVRDSQRELVSNVARNVSLAYTRAAADLDRHIAELRKPPVPADAEVLSRVVGEGKAWIGAAVVQTASRQALVASGVAVPIDQLPTPLPADDTVPVSTSDGPALVRIAALDGQRTLMALEPLLMRNLRLNPAARHGIFVIAPDGHPTLIQGVNAVDAAYLPKVFDGLTRSQRGQSRAVAVKEWRDRQMVVSSAPIGDTGFVVASVIIASVSDGTSLEEGLLLGSSLLVVAFLAFLLMRAFLVAPIQTLLRQAKNDACGAVTLNRQSLRTREAFRIAQALAVVSGAGLRGKRWRPTTMQGLTAAALVALAWPAVAVATTLHEPRPSLPEQLFYDEESRVEVVNSVLGNALDSGLQTVSRISLANTKTGPAKFEPVLKQGMANEHRFRGMYLVDPKGAVVKSAGRASLRTAEPLPGEAGIRIDSSIDRLPVIYAFRIAEDNGYAVVGEFDIDYLLGVMRRVDGRARVVDSDLRTVLDSSGYRAMQPLAGEAARKAAIAAIAGGTVRDQRTGGPPALMAATALTNPPSVAHLEWVVVVERNPASLQMPQVIMNRWTLLMAGTVAGVVALTFVWQFFIFVWPLQRLAASANRMRAGSFDEPVPPQRHDDVGAIAMCLEICRQVRHTGSARFGGAIRLRGSEEDFTAVHPRIPGQRGANRAAKV
ncbi:HAMP domain-containing protein [Dactylosporangium roseum]|uniref:HAMP domain-containing protein n=1 Tax=Dactylosporangium roseum TaxID=47989 RepID=A0ABY5ZE60_9ACTN|nr:HAMP domain-containing protein [Dactylosporangium roseum]